MMIDQFTGKRKFNENKIKKMPLPPPKNRSVCGTYLYFVEPGDAVNINLSNEFSEVLSLGGSGMAN